MAHGMSSINTSWMRGNKGCQSLWNLKLRSLIMLLGKGVNPRVFVKGWSCFSASPPCSITAQVMWETWVTAVIVSDCMAGSQLQSVFCKLCPPAIRGVCVHAHKCGYAVRQLKETEGGRLNNRLECAWTNVISTWVRSHQLYRDRMGECGFSRQHTASRIISWKHASDPVTSKLRHFWWLPKTKPNPSPWHLKFHCQSGASHVPLPCLLYDSWWRLAGLDRNLQLLLISSVTLASAFTLATPHLTVYKIRQ